VNSALRARIVTALLLAALVVVVLVGLPPEAAVAMIAVAIFAAGYEWAGSRGCSPCRPGSRTPPPSCWC
jgi:hypothetical protein